MAKFFGILGMCFCFYVISEFLGRISNMYDDNKPVSPFLEPLMYISVICLFLSLPVGLFILWHDSRMKKLHHKEFLNDRRPYDEMMKNRERYLEEEIAHLKEDLQKKRYDHSYKDLFEKRLEATRIEFYELGYTDGQEDYPLGINRIKDEEE